MMALGKHQTKHNRYLTMHTFRSDIKPLFQKQRHTNCKDLTEAAMLDSLKHVAKTTVLFDELSINF